MTTLKGLPIYNMTISDELDGVYKISLVDAPAIESNFILFDEEKKMELMFRDEDKHIITGPAMVPDMPIYRCDETGFEFYVTFSKETIRYIVDKERGIVPNDLNLSDGTWVVSLKCDNDELWDKLKNTDLLHGFSVETMNTAIQMAKQDKFDQEERQVEKKTWMDELLNMADQI